MISKRDLSIYRAFFNVLDDVPQATINLLHSGGFFKHGKKEEHEDEKDVRLLIDDLFDVYFGGNR